MNACKGSKSVGVTVTHLKGHGDGAAACVALSLLIHVFQAQQELAVPPRLQGQQVHIGRQGYPQATPLRRTTKQ